MKYLKFSARFVMALPVSVVIAALAWYLWLQEEWFRALDECRG